MLCKIFNRLKIVYIRLFYLIMFPFKKNRLSRNVKIYTYCNSNFSLGSNNSILGFGNIIIEENSLLLIKNKVYIGFFSNIRCSGKIEIGNNVHIGQFVSLLSGHYENYRDRNITIGDQKIQKNVLVIKDDSWIGANVTIIGNVTIGKGAIVGAGSIVTKNVLDYEIVAGNPAKKIGERI